MKKYIFVKDATGTCALLLAMAASLLLGLLSALPGGELLVWFVLVFGAAAQAMLFLHGAPLGTLLPLPLGTGVALLLGAAPSAAFFILAFYACGGVLAFAVRHRVERVATVCCLAVTLLLFFVGRVLWDASAAAIAAGYADLAAYLRDSIDAFRERLVDLYRALWGYESSLYEKLNMTVPPFPEEAMRTYFNQLFSILPALFILLLQALSLVMTYAMQFVSYVRGNSRAFAPTTWPYRIGTVTAGCFLLLVPIALFWGDFSSALYLACLNLFLILTPALAFGEILILPRIFSAYRRAVPHGLGKYFPHLLLVCLLLYSFRYAVLALAIIYAIGILKNAFARSPKKTEN